MSHVYKTENEVSRSSREDLAATLAALCQQLLGLESFGLDDDFFGRGGDTPDTIKLLSKIKKICRVDLELAAVSEARTMRLLADLIIDVRNRPIGDERSWTCLVPIQPKGSRTPLFCVHAIGGDIDLYVQMASALGADQPVYAFRSPLLFRRKISQIPLSELASIYVKEMKSFLPEGPYLLAGASLGGHIVFEMAQQLHAQGCPPELLLIIDAVVPGSDEYVDVKGRASTIATRLKSEGVSYLLRKIALKAEYLRQGLDYRIRSAASSLYGHLNLSLPAGLRFFQIEVVHKQALMRHEFGIYPGTITIMRAVDPATQVLSRRRDPELGWGQFAKNRPHVIDVPANHISMLYEPAVFSFAKLLDKILVELPSIVSK